MSSNSIKKLEPWKESLFRLPENKFLNIVRLYVGVIKTPYNKERLVSELISFLYKEDHKKVILSLLSERDILFLSAVFFLEQPTSETILNFFSGEFTAFYLYDYLSNLEERLLVYRHFDERNKKEVIVINPLLTEKIQSHLTLSVLVPLSSKKQEIIQEKSSHTLTESLFASWYVFISEYPDACRADGTFKKKIVIELEKKFYGVSLGFLSTLNIACINLGLFFYDGTMVFPDEKKWEEFSQLSLEMQQIYICVASFRRFSRDVLSKHASFSKNMLDSMPKEGLTKDSLLRLTFLLNNAKKDLYGEKNSSFFTKVLQRAQGNIGEESFSEEALIDKMLFLGLLMVTGKDKNEREILSLPTKRPEHVHTKKDFIRIDAGFSITFLTTVSLEKMLTLVKCMNLLNFDTVCRFEITRSSCMRSFDKGETNNKIATKLETASGKELTQNLAFSINEWYDTYNSASLYHGFVLQVSEEKRVQIENSTILSSRIKKILAPGIYLFDFKTSEEMMDAIEKSNLDFIGSPKQDLQENNAQPFITTHHKIELPLEYSNKKEISEAVCIAHIKNMKMELEKLQLPKEQEYGLQERINRKLIVSIKQLIGETVRSEKTEASGIDFMGKIQVIEQAIASSNMVEIVSANGIFIGRPIKLEKKEGDASVILTQEDSKTTTVLIGQARNIKRFRQNLF